MKFVFGNWKMYLDFDESLVLANQLATESYNSNKVEVAVFPNYLAITDVEMSLRDTSIRIGAQNCAWVPKGAYTGAISAEMLRSANCDYVLVGHSERRYVFGETDSDVRKKLEAVLDVGLTPVLCVGETKKDREEGKTEYRLKKQLMKALDGINLYSNGLIIAYEPVWAISNAGVGEPCDPEDANEAHELIDLEIKQYLDIDVPLLYGGSVTANNVLSYLAHDSVDGVLVGSAARKIETFSNLIRTVESM
jgi:triosephosphate isomerase (TIM)